MTRALDFFPDWRGANPFLSMLFAGLDDLGVEARPVPDVREHLAAAASSADPGVLNVHWTAPLLAGSGSPERARERVAQLAELLDGFQSAGGRLLWTVHNVLPHDARHLESQIEVCRLLAERADLVHVLTDVTVSEAEPHYRLDPARVVVIPHSSYTGVYPQEMGRRKARRRLGLDETHRVLSTLGQIRPYKGIDRLLEAFEREPLDARDLRLLVAGTPGNGAGVPPLVNRIRRTPRVVSEIGRVPDRQVQVWMKAADLAVLPYTAVLNSGSFLLAETFGLPIVAPRTGALVEREDRPHVRLFDPDDFASVLADAVRDLVDDHGAAATARASALADAEANPPELMARRFAAAVAPLWGL
jgi:glycosyltransferase involved in cell wall biosynthesis